MRLTQWALSALLAGSAISTGANASTFMFDFSGVGVSGKVSLSYIEDPNTSATLDSSPNAHDPLGSYIITGVTGTFSDNGLGLANVGITGLEGLNPVSPEPTNLKAPNRFSLLNVANGVDDGSGHPSKGFHYDNIFYPLGSPQTATDYPFAGGFFDIYGMVFTLANGDAVNLWSNGVQPGLGLNYGVAVTDRVDVLDYVNGVAVRAVPEPASWALMISGFGAVGAAMRNGRRKSIVSFS